MPEKLKGFGHSPDPEQIEEYCRWPVERRLAWLMAGNQLRRDLPERVRRIQDRFRRGEI